MAYKNKIISQIQLHTSITTSRILFCTSLGHRRGGLFALMALERNERGMRKGEQDMLFL